MSNIGKYTGTETLQLYIRDLAGSVARPVRELKGFAKVTLLPGEEQKVTFTITEPMLRFYGINGKYASEPGGFELFIGTDSNAGQKGTFVFDRRRRKV